MPLAVLVVFSTLFAADISEPTSSAAIAAKKSFAQQIAWAKAEREQELKRINTAYEAEIAKAKIDYEKKMRDALKTALAAQNLEESNRIDAAIKELPEVASNTPPEGKYRTRIVRGKGGGDDYLVDWVVKGTTITEVRYVDAKGKVFDWGASGKTKGTLKVRPDGSFRLDQGDWGYSDFTFVGSCVFIERYQRHGIYDAGAGEFIK